MVVVLDFESITKGHQGLFSTGRGARALDGFLLRGEGIHARRHARGIRRCLWAKQLAGRAQGIIDDAPGKHAEIDGCDHRNRQCHPQ